MNWCEVQLFFAAPPRPKDRLKALDSASSNVKFHQDRTKTKKLWLSIVPAQKLSEQPGLGPPQKGVNCNFSWPEFDKPYGVRK